MILSKTFPSLHISPTNFSLVVGFTAVITLRLIFPPSSTQYTECHPKHNSGCLLMDIHLPPWAAGLPYSELLKRELCTPRSRRRPLAESGGRAILPHIRVSPESPRQKPMAPRVATVNWTQYRGSGLGRGTRSPGPAAPGHLSTVVRTPPSLLKLRQDPVPSPAGGGASSEEDFPVWGLLGPNSSPNHREASSCI